MTISCSVKDLVFTYQGEPTINKINFDIHRGEIHCLLGPSGSGKSTILRLLLGIEKPDAGEIYIGEQCVTSDKILIPPEQRNIGMVFQNFSLFPHLDIWHNISFGIRKLPKDIIHERCNYLLKAINLSQMAHKYPNELSGGEQQRVALARAMATNPPILLLDEPFSGLDSKLHEDLRDFTLHFLHSMQATALIVTHSPEEAMAIASNIILINEGTVQQQGKPDELYFYPKNRFCASFFGMINQFETEIMDGCIKTPLGQFEVNEASNYQKAMMMVRPESIKLEINAEHPQAICDEVKFLGRHSIIHLTTLAHLGRQWHFHALVIGKAHIKPKDLVVLSVNKNEVFIF
ncbi:MAG: ABC transporter ATP-binding protein [Gammaproteobacteria bacterium]|nr:ABC transporter ATP-binding protein [Gammaproteobacteria bacterium]